MPTSRRSSRRRPRLPSAHRSTCCAAVSTTSALRSPTSCACPNSHRILVELPGVKEPQRVRDLLQGTASLEFWTTYDATRSSRAVRCRQAHQGRTGAGSRRCARDRCRRGCRCRRDSRRRGRGPDRRGRRRRFDRHGRDRRSGRQLRPLAEPALCSAQSPLRRRRLHRSRLQGRHGSRQRVPRPAGRPRAVPRRHQFKWGVKGDDKIDGRIYLYAIKVSTPDGKAPLDGSVVTERHRAVRPARRYGRGVDDHERRRYAGVVAHDGREYRQVHRHRPRRVRLFGSPREHRRSTRDSRRSLAISRFRRRKTWPTCSTRVRFPLRPRSSRIRS